MVLVNPYESTQRRSHSQREMQENFRVSFPNLDDFLRCEWKESVEVNYSLLGIPLGWGTLRVQRGHQGEIEYDRFYPHAFKEGVKRRGIGTLAHVATLIEVVEKVLEIDESYTVFHNPLSTSDEYTALLKTIGVGFKESINPYIAKCIAYAARRGFSFTSRLI